MVQAATNSPTPTTSAGHPSPPSRLLSKHHPRRRAALPRPNPPAPGPTRGQPDLTTCHCCGVRFPPTVPGSKRHQVRPLRSVWRIVLLCEECLSLVHSAAVCSYCLSLDNLLPEDTSVTCRRCSRCVHHHCILAEHRTAMVQPIDLDNFACVDCCPAVKPGGINGGVTSVPKLEASAWEITSPARSNGDSVPVAKLNSLRKAVEAKRSSNRAKETIILINGDGGSERTDTGDLDLADEDFALQLHLAMNGSPRISRCNPSSGQVKGQKGLITGRKGSRDHGICVTNMMDQLDGEETAVETGSNWSAKHVGKFDPSFIVVLALECEGGHAMRGKRKNAPRTKQHNGLMDRFKNKYSKRNSSEQVNLQRSESKTISDGAKVITP